MTSTIEDFAIRAALEEIEAIIGTGIFHPDNKSSPLFRNSLARTLVLLSDCLQRSANTHKLRCDLEPLGRASKANGDLTDVIADNRNHMSHAFSGLKTREGNYIGLISIVGPGKLPFNGETLEGREGDLLIGTLNTHFFLVGDFLRAYEWACGIFAPDISKVVNDTGAAPA